MRSTNTFSSFFIASSCGWTLALLAIGETKETRLALGASVADEEMISIVITIEENLLSANHVGLARTLSSDLVALRGYSSTQVTAAVQSSAVKVG